MTPYVDGTEAATDRCCEQSIINDAVDRWPKRLRACTRVKGGHLSIYFTYG